MGIELGAVVSPAEREARFIVHGQPFDEPVRAEGVGEERCGPPEHAAREAPGAVGAVEVENVHHLVEHDRTAPFLVVAQRVLVHRRPRVDHDPVRRERRGVAVGKVHVVGENDVNDPLRRAQVLAQARVGPLGVRERAPCERLHSVREMHADVVAGERLPVEVRAHLCRQPHDAERQRGEREQDAAQRAGPADAEASHLVHTSTTPQPLKSVKRSGINGAG